MGCLKLTYRNEISALRVSRENEITTPNWQVWVGGKGAKETKEVEVNQSGGSNQNMNSETSNAFIFGTGFAGVRKAGQMSVQEINRQAAVNKSLNSANGSSIKVPKGVKFIGKFAGFAFSAWSAVDVEQQFSDGEITGFQRGAEQVSNGIGAIPGVGTGWSIGWEIGRAITNIDSYQEWKQNTWFPWRQEVLGY